MDWVCFISRTVAIIIAFLLLMEVVVLDELGTVLQFFGFDCFDSIVIWRRYD